MGFKGQNQHLRPSKEETIISTRLNPYLSFRDTAREAMDFYTSVFGGELTTSTFAEFHVKTPPSRTRSSIPC
jgi:PhnB protein